MATQPEDLSLLAAGTWAAFVEGWELQNKREVARAQAPMRLDMSKQRMRMSGGSYAVGQGINAPRDPVSGIPYGGLG
jgi:hypothetical protein